jgi:hypothetical protein
MKHHRRPGDRSVQEKLKAVIEFEGLEVEKQGEYLRREGLYSEHIAGWKKSMEVGLESGGGGLTAANRSEWAADKKKIKELIREGDPESPALWQETTDFVNNVWWLNLLSPEARFAFKQRSSNPELWRSYHAEKVIEMVVQVWMGEEFTRKGESQRPDFWAGHLATMNRLEVQIVQQMWKKIEPYINKADGGSLIQAKCHDEEESGKKTAYI